MTTEIEAPEINTILRKEILAPSLFRMVLYTPVVADKVLPGQFVVIRCDEVGERIPLTVVDFDREKKTIEIIVQEVGFSTEKMAKYEEGSRFTDIVGPLGVPSEVENIGTAVFVGGGVGVAPVYPIARAFKETGNRVISIIGAREKDLVILEERMRACSDEVLITTDDGSYGHHGFVTDELKRIIEEGTKIDRVVAIGPAIMMREVCKVTKAAGIKTIVSLNTLMVDGTGMCGGCRVSVGDEAQFVCVDGPEFDGHKVDFDEMMTRQGTYQREERRAVWQHTCTLETGKKKLIKRREPMPRQDPRARVQNFDEVALGYTKEQAVREAVRCLDCKKPKCINGCPVEIDIPAFIELIRDEKFIEAAKKIKEKNCLPAVCGRVCPQEDQCEQVCLTGKKGDPVAIGRLERFAADYEAAHGVIEIPDLPPQTGRKVAIVGAGPAGLTVAGDLAKLGHEVVVFEALHASGGVLVYGIPQFRLPKEIVRAECEYVEKLGVEIRTSYIVGRSSTVDELIEKEGFDAVFIGTGAGLPYFMGIPGENLMGVYSANEFLTRVNLMKAYRFPEYDTPVRLAKNYAVVGGGNVAMDSARSALRLGANNVFNVYRRSREEMPAREEEIVNAIEEGVQMTLLTNPIRLIGDDKGWVKGMECISMELGEPDASGRRRPVPIEGSEHIIDVEVVIMAIGQGANPLLTKTTPDLGLNKWGNIIADEETGRTNKKGVFAGGDIVTGAATVILAMGAGRKAAMSIHDYLETGVWELPPKDVPENPPLP